MMRVGVFWVCAADRWMERAAASLTEAHSDGKEQPLELAFFARQPAGNIRKFASGRPQSPYAAVNDLCDIFETATVEGLDIALISFGRGLPCDVPLLQAFLYSEDIQKSVWSFRVGNIAGVGLLNPPRLPFVDDHFVVLNVNRARECDFFSRKLIQASHFAANSRSAEFTSMIEHCVEPGELNNHFFASKSRDAYGELAPLDPMPFHLCEATGFMVCYPELLPSLEPLMALNIQRSSVGKSSFFFTKRRGFWYKRNRPWLKIIVSRIRGLIYDIGRHEFKKRQD